MLFKTVIFEKEVPICVCSDADLDFLLLPSRNSVSKKSWIFSSKMQFIILDASFPISQILVILCWLWVSCLEIGCSILRYLNYFSQGAGFRLISVYEIFNLSWVTKWKYRLWLEVLLINLFLLLNRLNGINFFSFK